MELVQIARGAADDAGGLDVGLLGDFLPVVVDAALSGRSLRRPELARFSASGAGAAAAGVPLRALVDLYLSASWRLWRDLPEVTAGDVAQVKAAALAVLRAADDGVAALAEGYQLARGDLVRRQAEERREVFEALLSGGRAAEEVLGRAADLGLDLTGPQAVLVADPVGGLAGAGASAVLGRVERALAGRLGDAQPLVSAQRGQLVCVVAAPSPGAIEEVGRRVAAVLRSPSGPPWRLAVGRPLVGASGVRVSYEQARDTLDLAARLGLSQEVVVPSELAVYRVLLRDRDALVELIATVLGPLTGVRGGAAPLLATLEAYFATGAVATETARRLHLSVRAVTYRLSRVHQVLGRDPSDPAQRFALQAAVLGAVLLDWPAVPLRAEDDPA